MSRTDTPRVLKAESLRGLGSKVVFDYEDLRRRGDSYVEEARRRAETLLQDAHREADEVRAAAHEEGRQAGLAEGLADADARLSRRAAELVESTIAEKLASLVPAIESAIEELMHERDRLIAEWDAQAVRAVTAIAEKIVRQRLDVRPEAVLDVVSSALELAAGTPRIEIHMHPADVELLEEHGEPIRQSIASRTETTFVADASVSRGGCVLETPEGTIDARIETQLQRIADELLM